MSYTFIRNFDGEGVVPSQTIQHVIHSDDLTLDEILFNFTDFLRGCGYIFDGELQIVDIASFNTPINRGDETEHSSFYWDTDRNK